MQDHDVQTSALTRRRVLGWNGGIASLALMSSPALAQGSISAAWRTEHADDHDILSAKGPNDPAAFAPAMARDAFEVFDTGVFTPNDQHSVRWHWAIFPTEVNVDDYRLTVHGLVNQPLSLSLREILQGLPQVDIAAVNQWSAIRVFTLILGSPAASGQMARWATRWTGVRLKGVLDRAGVKPAPFRSVSMGWTSRWWRAGRTSEIAHPRSRS